MGNMEHFEEHGTASSGPSTMTNDYDEDLSKNPFFQAFLQSYVDLFSQCVCEKWTICVPRRDSLPKYAFTLEDFTHHILKPLQLCQELKSRKISSDGDGGGEEDSATEASSPPILSRASSSSNLSTTGGSVCSSGTFYTQPSQSFHRNWNFRTLTDVHIEYLDNTLYLDSTESSSNNNEARAIPVLFEETFYTTDKRKYKILCIASPLNSKVEECDDEDGHRQLKSPSLWNLSSLRDCIDFLWLNGRPKALEKYDAQIKLFLHNHRALEDLPLPVQKDLVHDLYLKCLVHATKGSTLSKRSKKKSLSTSSSRSSTSSSTETINSSNSPVPPIDLTHSLPNFKLATETYVLSGIYRQLINAITSSLSHEDAALNKIIRNLAEIHPQDLDINIIHWDNFPRARQELSRMNLHSSPLAKLCCLKKTMRYLKPEKCLAMFDESNGRLSADELLPIWVYLIVKTPLDNWIAQLQYLRHFRFSAQDAPDNEFSFYTVTLEAAITHLNSGKISGLPESERDVGIPCEVGVGEYWLRCLFNSMDDNDTTSHLGEMFTCIRQGHASKLEELVCEYEGMRRNQEVVSAQGYDESKLCHPLCNCPECRLITNPEPEPVMKPVFELKNEEGLTLLHVACIYGRPKIVDYILACNAPFDVEDYQGMRPLHYAASKGHQNALLLLLHAGCELEPRDHMLNTPLHFAAMNGHEPCLKALIYYAEHSKQSIGVSSPNYNGETPLHFASRLGFIGIVQLLVESGASITATNSRQTTPIDCAHDIHVLRMLQRSLKRRSLIHTNHEDFVNIEVMKKGDTDGCIMLISEPKEPPPTPPASQNGESGRKLSFSSDNNNETKDSFEQGHSRRDSFTSVTGMNGVLTRRKTSSVTTPSFGSSLRQNNTENSSGNPENYKSRHKRSLLNGDSEHKESNNGEMTFQISNVIPETPSESEHLRKVPIDNLDHAPHVLAQMASLGVRRKREVKQRGIRKLFTSIAVGDIPLALFYLGIPAEEIDMGNDIVPGVAAGAVPCHPLCPCNRCTARSAGLGLDINVRNTEGLTPLQSAVQHNLYPLVTILLKYGADASLRSTYESKTALEFAKERYYEDIAVTLQSWKAALPADDLQNAPSESLSGYKSNEN